MVILTSLLIMAISIYLLAIITDGFFIESLDQISHNLNLPSHVAGASLMAMGSSAPELAIALFAVFKQGGAHSDVGIGTIVGSAVFNILVITGISAIVRPTSINWKASVRDSLVYVVSVLVLIMVFYDGTITIVESLVFISIYVAYLLILLKWSSFFPDEEDQHVSLIDEVIDKEDPEPGPLQTINRIVEKPLALLAGDPRASYTRAFAVSILLIAGLSWLLVDYAVVFANALSIPPVVVALTILAAGTSAPDLIASVIVARQGRGEMAIANAIGSNIFDILIGLGVPWLIAITLRYASVLPGAAIVQVGTKGLWLSAFILLASVVLLFFFLWTGRRLSKREGYVLVSCYVLYALWTWIAGA